MSSSPAGQLQDPFQLKSEDGYEWIKGNLHSHTTNSDGRVDPQTRVDGYAAKGYDYLCLSDHYRITPVDSVTATDGIVLIQGAELHPDNPFGGQRHHLVSLNITEDVDSESMHPQEVIDAVKGQGGSTWLAHPHWSSVIILRDTHPLSGLDGIEVFNTTCRCAARGESSIHWDDWMSLQDRLYPALANDDAHAAEEENRDTFGGWTMARVKSREPGAIVEALVSGATYSTTGPVIEHIELRLSESSSDDRKVVQATVRCSEASRIFAVADSYGTEYLGSGGTFEEATFDLRPNARWTRFEVVDPGGLKAWCNPYDLTGFYEG